MVVGHAVFGVDLEHPVQRLERILVAAPQETGAAERPPGRPVSGERLEHPAVRERGVFVAAVFPEDLSPDPGGPRIAGVDGLGALQRLVRQREIPLGEGGAREVQRAVDAVGGHGFHPRERSGGPSQVTLQQQGDPVVVVARPVARAPVPPVRSAGPRRGDQDPHRVGGDPGYRQVGRRVESGEAGRVRLECKNAVRAIELPPQQARRHRER